MKPIETTLRPGTPRQVNRRTLHLSCLRTATATLEAMFRQAGSGPELEIAQARLQEALFWASKAVENRVRAEGPSPV